MVIRECALADVAARRVALGVTGCAPEAVHAQVAAPVRALHPDVRGDLARLIDGRQTTGHAREAIVASWERTLAHGLRPDRVHVPYTAATSSSERLARAAVPVITGLADDLVGTELAVILSDDQARIIDRRATGRQGVRRLDRICLAPGFSWSESDAGTNGIGTAIAERSAIMVAGDEHFADALTGLTSAAVAVTDSRTAEVLGALGLVCDANIDGALLCVIAKRAAREVEQRLIDGASAIERLLHEHFLRARRRARGPLVLIAPDTMLTNTAAARMFAAEDHLQLWRYAERALTSSAEWAVPFTAPDGTTFSATYEAIHDGGTVVGALLRLSPPSGPVATRRRPRKPTSRRPTFGWASLSDTERGIAHLVASGLTNRELAVRQFLSPHTVDSQLRHIFRKLGISSRVDLARLVMQHESTCDALRLATRCEPDAGMASRACDHV
jgi:DNA-binding CsgD family transcriptional regulator